MTHSELKMHSAVPREGLPSSCILSTISVSLDDSGVIVVDELVVESEEILEFVRDAFFREKLPFLSPPPVLG